MLPLQTTYPLPPQMPTSETPPPAHAQQQAGPEFNESFIEALAQRLVPRLMPEILYHVRAAVPPAKRDHPFGMSLALAIVSLVLLIPLVAIVLADLTFLGIVAALIIVSVLISRRSRDWIYCEWPRAAMGHTTSTRSRRVP